MGLHGCLEGPFLLPPETGRGLGPFAAIPAAHTSLLQQQNTKKRHGTENNSTPAHLGQILNSQLVQSLSRVQLLATSWTAACQASLFITNSQSLLKLMSIELVRPSNHLILCCPLLLQPSILPKSGSFLMSQVAKVWEFQL